MTTEEFYKLISTRNPYPHYQQQSIEQELLIKMLDCAHWAPSGFNLQPTHYYVVQDNETKKKLYKPCLYQSQVVEAPVLVVFAGDRHCVENNLEEILDYESSAGILTEDRENKIRKGISLYFDHGFLKIEWLAKFLAPITKLFTPLPSFPAVEKRLWLTKQVMMSAMNFINAAESAGLTAYPIENFDEWKVRRILKIPHSYVLPIIVAVGHSVEDGKKDWRLPVQEFINWC